MKIYKNSVSKKERIILGCKAIVGENVSEVAQEYNINRPFIYTQKEKVEKVLDEYFDKPEESEVLIPMDERVINRIVLSCMLDCKGSVRDVKEFFRNVFNLNISEGKISTILNEAATKATKFNESIMLNNIKIGAHDEIFQAGDPVLVGVDPLTTYTYLMQGSDKRDGIAWSMAIYEKYVNQELDLDTSVTDGGLGMKKGIREVYPNINEQGDIFHMEMKLTVGLSIIERKAYGAITKEYEAESKFKKAASKKQDSKKAAYDKSILTSKEIIEVYDKINILICWVRELFSKGGYTHAVRMNLIDYIINEINATAHGNKQLEDAVKTLSLNKENFLLFVKIAEEQIDMLANKDNMDRHILNLLWQQKCYSENSNKYWAIENKILKLSDNNTIERTKEKFEAMFKKLVRASSIVENINSLIRPYLFLRRTLKGKFLNLLQFYLNTRKYMESRVEERKGKSPLELLTGKEQGLWLDLLGY
jgi:hypothetical protein